MSKKRRNKKQRINTTPTFPVGNTILLVIILIIQIVLLAFGFTNDPQPQDLIRDYRVTVEPQENGSLDITYAFVWEALDQSEELTWVEIGMANENFFVYPRSFSSTVSTWNAYTDDGYCALQLDFKDAYTAGDVVEFSFKINQKDMLCKDENGYFYEFVPGWFNSIRVEHYEFIWRMDGGEDVVRSGSLDYGGYDMLSVRYGPDAFAGCETVEYWPFSHSEAYNGLEADRLGMIFMCCIIAGLLVIAEVYIIDSYVSYHRGRGFLTGYGHHVHMYGRSNPRYVSARDRHIAQSSSRGGRSGGCACACACACAGGGRAGCSQKDTYDPGKAPLSQFRDSLS